LRKNLQLLEELQRIDLKIDELRREKEGMLSEVAALELEEEGARRLVAEKKSELETLEADKLALEGNLATEADNIVRSETRQKELKTQKEFQAVAKEVSTARKLKNELEEQILQKLGLAEALNAEIDGMEANLQSLSDNLASRKGGVQARIDQMQAAIAADQATREATAKGIPASALKRYNLLREKRQGIAVVEARDGYCLGCNMNLPPQLYNSLYKVTELVNCPHCQRVLFLHNEQGEK
jgi:predicted  nucleic acid-binding Zn-ribbon protein